MLVRVQAAGLDRGTWHLMTGTPYAVRLVTGLRRPKQPVLGLDLAGTVAAVGSAVTRFAPGDEVYGIGTGTFAEYAVAREDKLAAKPANLTFEQAAAFRSPRSPPSRRSPTSPASGRASACSSSAPRAASAATPSRSPSPRVPRSPACRSAVKADLVRSLGATHFLDYAHRRLRRTGQSATT